MSYECENECVRELVQMLQHRVRTTMQLHVKPSHQ